MADKVVFVCSNCGEKLAGIPLCVPCENKKSTEATQNERNLREVLKVFDDLKFILDANGNVTGCESAATKPKALRVAIISCSKNKQKGTYSARELYNSALFKASMEYALKNFDRVYILSAKYGLIRPDERIRTYDLSLKSMSGKKRLRWAQIAAVRMIDKIPKGSGIYFFCGKLYREKIMSFPAIKEIFKLHAPLKGLSIGKQLRWFRSHNKRK